MLFIIHNSMIRFWILKQVYIFRALVITTSCFAKNCWKANLHNII